VEASEIKNGRAFKVQPGTHAGAIQRFYDIMLPHIAAFDGTPLMVNQTRSRIEMSQDANSAAAGYETMRFATKRSSSGWMMCDRCWLRCTSSASTSKRFLPSF
jgi:hypothetical protein